MTKLAQASADAEEAREGVIRWANSVGWEAHAGTLTKKQRRSRVVITCGVPGCKHKVGNKANPDCRLVQDYEVDVPRFDLPFNPASSQQLGELLYSLLRYPVPSVTKSGPNRDGKLSTDVGALEWLRDQRGKRELDTLLNYRKITRSAEFLRMFLEVGAEHLDGSFRIHPQFKRGTATGRLSCANPNLQQVPGAEKDPYRAREIFTALPGHLLVVADYAALEYVIAAHIHVKMFGDRKLADNLHTIHEQVAVMVFGRFYQYMRGVRPEDVKGHEDKRVRAKRSAAKTVGYGLSYGMSADGLGAKLVDDHGKPVGKAMAAKIREAYLDFLPAIRAYQEWVERTVLSGEPIPTVGGRWRMFDASNEGVRAALNYPPQGSGADIVDSAIRRLHRALPAGCILLNQVHDELVYMVPERLADRAAELVRREMCSAWKLEVPLDVTVKVCENWAEAK